MLGNQSPAARAGARRILLVAVLVVVAIPFLVAYFRQPVTEAPAETPAPPPVAIQYLPRSMALDTGGYFTVEANVQPWKPDATLQEIADLWRHAGSRILDTLDQQTAITKPSGEALLKVYFVRAGLFNWKGRPGAPPRCSMKLDHSLRVRTNWHRSFCTHSFFTRA
jgi:hypothetical protein